MYKRKKEKEEEEKEGEKGERERGRDIFKKVSFFISLIVVLFTNIEYIHT